MKALDIRSIDNKRLLPNSGSALLDTDANWVLAGGTTSSGAMFLLASGPADTARVRGMFIPLNSGDAPAPDVGAVTTRMLSLIPAGLKSLIIAEHEATRKAAEQPAPVNTTPPAVVDSPVAVPPPVEAPVNNTVTEINPGVTPPA
jgi:hypothetical protein